jgi:biopolymer transport protein ExbB
MGLIRNVAKVLTLAMVGTLFSPSAFAWWNDDWAFRKEITFDLSPAGANIAGSPADTPVLIRLSLGNFEFFADAKPDGSDFRFIAADDKTLLKHHVERFDATSQMALVWVRLPRLAGGAAADKIFLYYGNPEAPDAADKSGTYDANSVLVYHFGAAGGSAQDATAYKTEPSSFQAEVNPASLIGAGLRFNGTQSVSVPATAALQLVPEKGLTVSAWVKFDAQQAGAQVVSLGDGVNRLALGIDGLTAYASLESAGAAALRAAAAEPLQAGSWVHLAVRADSGRLRLFVNGAESAGVDATLVPVAGELTVGTGPAGSGGFVGELDELHVSNVARPNEWIEAAARSQGMVAPLVVYGGDAQQEGGGEGYFATTMRNVTIDGWVVVVLCAILFLLSMAIMIGKALLLNRVVKGNAQFLAEFRKLSDDPTALDRTVNANNPDNDEEDSAFEAGRGSQVMSALASGKHNFGVSTLYRLYHHGVRETNKRLAGQAAGADRVKTLSPAAIEAIRATMDASLTRMTQRLSEQMVWLTISISGGPFLGLLGTVVGVMITFAAIAASGDVNVNAIAPGIAAALVATVAGLGVAIPCLFGYNYLNTRIKEINADMRVFVDEFVSRIAESYTS